MVTELNGIQECHTDIEHGLSEEALAMLESPLDPTTINVNNFDRSKPAFEYMRGQDVIATANRIFGHDGWSYKLLGPVEFIENEKNPKQSFYRASVSVYVKGVGTREHVANFSLAMNTAKGHDTAMAGAVTTALKRAMRTFGEQFGLNLKSESDDADSRPDRYQSRLRPNSPSMSAAATQPAQTAKRWADNAGVDVQTLCRLMNIPTLSDREVLNYMGKQNIREIAFLPAHLSKIHAASKVA